MGIFAELKFLEEDKRFITDRYVQALGGINRIKQLLNMDKQFVKELNFYIKELENPRFMDNPKNVNAMEENLVHLEASLEKERAFTELLMNIAIREHSKQPDSRYMLDEVNALRVTFQLRDAKSIIKQIVSKMGKVSEIVQIPGGRTWVIKGLKEALEYFEE